MPLQISSAFRSIELHCDILQTESSFSWWDRDNVLLKAHSSLVIEHLVSLRFDPLKDSGIEFVQERPSEGRGNPGHG